MFSFPLRGFRVRRQVAFATALATCLMVIAPVVALAQSANLSLAEALTRAAEADPTMTATRRRLDAADANIRQAGVRPNPSLGIEAENILGANPYNGVNAAEFTLTYQQELERKSKRQARVGAASAERDLVRAEGRLRTWEAMNLAHVLWVEAAAAEAEVRVARDRLSLAEQAQAEISRRVRAARDPLFAGSLANADVANARIALDQATARAREAKLQLAALWGGGADFSIDPSGFEAIGATDAPETDAPETGETPDLEVLRARERLSASQIRVETTRRVQDPTVSAGIRHFREDGAVAFVVGGSIPLNRFDSNQGNIDRRRAEAAAAAADIEVAERIRQRDIAAASLRLSALAQEVRRIDAEVMPQAETAVAQVREGFARGGFSYRDVMGAQEILIAARARRVEVLKAFQLEKARHARLTGQWVRLIPAETAQP